MCFLVKGPLLQGSWADPLRKRDLSGALSLLFVLMWTVISGGSGRWGGVLALRCSLASLVNTPGKLITWASSFLSQEFKVVLMCCSLWTVTLQPVFLYCEAAVNICPRGEYVLGFSRLVFVPHTPAAAFGQPWPRCRGKGRLLVQLPWGLLSVAPLPVSSWLIDLIAPFWRGEDRWSLQSFLLPHFPVCPIPVNF